MAVVSPVEFRVYFGTGPADVGKTLWSTWLYLLDAERNMAVLQAALAANELSIDPVAAEAAGEAFFVEEALSGPAITGDDDALTLANASMSKASFPVYITDTLGNLIQVGTIPGHGIAQLGLMYDLTVVT